MPDPAPVRPLPEPEVGHPQPEVGVRPPDDDIRLGAALGWAQLSATDERYRDTFLASFDAMTPENEMKMDALRPGRDRFDFSTADKMVEFAEAHGKRVRGHTLVWHNQLPAWLTSRSWTRTELLEVLETHVKTVVGHYRGRVEEWDVVNEPLSGDGSLRPSIWGQVIGPEYIELALRWAHEADPEAKLFVNDYSTERLNAKSDAMLALARTLIDAGVPLQGVGFQTHISTTWHPTREELRANLERFAALGLDANVTELDVTTSETSGTEADRLERQAEVYRLVGAACAEVPRCRGLTTWGFTDASSWLGGDEMPLLFDASYIAKPSWEALRPSLDRP